MYISFDISGQVLVLVIFLLTLSFLSIFHIISSFDERKDHTKFMLFITIPYTLISLMIVDLISLILYFIRPDKKILDFFKKDSILRNIIPLLITNYEYRKYWKVSDIVIAERKLSGLCIECGIGEDNTRHGHHKLCRTANDPSKKLKKR